jgi:hypothetical protein
LAASFSRIQPVLSGLISLATLIYLVFKIHRSWKYRNQPPFRCPAKDADRKLWLLGLSISVALFLLFIPGCGNGRPTPTPPRSNEPIPAPPMPPVPQIPAVPDTTV